MQIKNLCYWLLVQSAFGKTLNNKPLGIIVAAIGGATLLYFDIFGSDDAWVNSHPQEVFRIFIGILFGGAAIQLLRWIGEWSAGSGATEGSSISELLISVGRIVQWKSTRFRNALPKLAGKSPFEIITQPTEQIQFILDEANDYFRRHRKIEGNQLEVTVLKQFADASIWEFIFSSNPNRSQKNATSLMKGHSAAAKAHQSGVPCFHASKTLASKNNLYLPSARDIGDGSIFCYPIKLAAPSGSVEFVVTFTTYGKLLCDPKNLIAKQGVEFILTEFVRRIELELILWTIKDFKKGDRQSKLPKRRGKN